jgi:uncharacterized repeat protein (TIGR03803 family)
MPREQFGSALKTALVAMLLWICLAASAWASAEKVLWDFIGNPRGTSPSSLISDGAGNLYGTSQGGGLYSQGTIFKLTPQAGGGWTETVLHNFPGGERGSTPLAALVMDAAGNLYGTTSQGGYLQNNCSPGGCGTVFELSPGADGKWLYEVLHAFQSTDGAVPRTPLTLDASGSLFGTTPFGGTCGDSGCGIVFKLAPSTGGKWNETVLYNFPCISGCTETGVPASDVIFDSAGNLYGTTDEDASGPGAVFELKPGSNGWTESVLHYFCTQPHCADGDFPRGGLIFDQAGNLYGTTAAGGTKAVGGGDGVVFELTPGKGGDWSETVLFTFHGGKEGFAPFSGVVFDAKGNLYGTTIWGGEGGGLCRGNNGFGCGTVFKLTPSAGLWTESIVHDFRAGRDGIIPSGVLLDSGGNIYGTTTSSGAPPNFTGGATSFKLTASSNGWHETVHHFGTSAAISPNGGLISDGAGNLYGTTSGGGSYEYGTVFELSPVAGGRWQSRVLYSFKGGTDGSEPEAPLVFDQAGNLYGTTFEGGSADNVGVVFQLSPGSGGRWNESILHVFQGPDGLYPVGGLVFDGVGNLYGATYEGGATCCGVVFELSPSNGSWTENVLHNFTGGASDGWNPLAGVVLDSAGNIYGTTAAGGNVGNGGSGYGTVFELSPGSGGVWTENILHRFTGGSDGWFPEGSVILDQAGDVYGTTYWGGSSSCYHGCGVVFKLSPTTGNRWKETIIRGLDGSVANPQSSLVFDASGNLYGSSSGGGGAIFELEPHSGKGWWKLTTLYTFAGGRGGSYPGGPLLLDAAGNLYDAASGGPAGNGFIFEITP